MPPSTLPQQNAHRSPENAPSRSRPMPRRCAKHQPTNAPVAPVAVRTPKSLVTGVFASVASATGAFPCPFATSASFASSPAPGEAAAIEVRCGGILGSLSLICRHQRGWRIEHAVSRAFFGSCSLNMSNDSGFIKTSINSADCIL